MGNETRMNQDDASIWTSCVGVSQPSLCVGQQDPTPRPYSPCPDNIFISIEEWGGAFWN